MRNILGIEVPSQVEQCAKQHGCVNGVLYIYQDGQYGGRPPKASIGCEKARPFRTRDWNPFNVTLAPGWVAFSSPSNSKRQPGGKPKRVVGKGVGEPCIICGEDRFTEAAHFPTPSRKSGTATIDLCPTHHKLLDNGRLSDWEWEKILQCYPQPGFTSAKDLVDWVHKHGYEYSYYDVQKKAVRKEYKGPRQIVYRIENKPRE